MTEHQFYYGLVAVWFAIAAAAFLSLFFISAPNYFGELLEWTGWAMATWSICGVTRNTHLLSAEESREVPRRPWKCRNRC